MILPIDKVAVYLIPHKILNISQPIDSLITIKITF